MKKTILFSTIISMFTFAGIAYAGETLPETTPETETEIAIDIDLADNEGLLNNKAKVTVDLSNGWVVEFDYDAMFLYENEDDDDFVGSAMLLNEEAFKEFKEEAQASDTYKEYARSFSYVDEDGAEDHFYSLAPNVYLVISVEKGADPDEVIERINVELLETEETETE